MYVLRIAISRQIWSWCSFNTRTFHPYTRHKSASTNSLTSPHSHAARTGKFLLCPVRTALLLVEQLNGLLSAAFSWIKAQAWKERDGVERGLYQRNLSVGLLAKKKHIKYNIATTSNRHMYKNEQLKLSDTSYGLRIPAGEVVFCDSEEKTLKSQLEIRKIIMWWV